MSAPKALKATSLRDSLGKTVRLLTKQGINVQFRGHQPYVATRGDKVLRLVLPELNDNAPPEVIEAIQGFLDHEVGHIFYTPFGRAQKFNKGNKIRACVANIIEDIRLEKLMPRDLPGTKENLERMYDSVMDSFFGPAALRANEPGVSKNEAFSCVMVCAMRALAGQKAFQKFMDDNKLWPHFMPLVSRMPDISRRLRDMETYQDVERLVDDILVALAPPPKEENDDPESDKSEDDQFTGIDPNATDDKDDGASDDSAGDSDESNDGEGHGDGEGTDDGEGDDEAGSCAGGDGDDDGEPGDDASDETGDEAGGGDDADTDADAGGSADDGDDQGTPADNDLEGDPKGDGKEGKQNRTLRDALALLEPTHRRALFLYKKRKQTVEQIAEDLSITEDETLDILSQARRKLRDLLNGGK